MEDAGVDLASFNPAELGIFHFRRHRKAFDGQFAIVSIFTNSVSYVSGKFLLGERHTGEQVFSGLPGANIFFRAARLRGRVNFKKGEIPDNQLITQCQICHWASIS